MQLAALRDVTDEHTRDAPTGASDLKHAAVAALSAPGHEVDALLDEAVLCAAAALTLELAGIFVHRGPRRPMLLRAEPRLVAKHRREGDGERRARLHR